MNPETRTPPRGDNLGGDLHEQDQHGDERPGYINAEGTRSTAGAAR